MKINNQQFLNVSEVKMKKKVLFVLFLFLLIIFLYTNQLNKKSKLNISEIEGITMMVKDDTSTRSGATIIITDLNKNKYDEWYKIEKYTNNEWKNLKTKAENGWLNLPGYLVNDSHILEINVDWESLYGKLGDGRYRLIKRVSDKYIAVEFIIN